MEFDLQAVWTTAGASAAVLLIGYIFGFLQSVVPFIPTTGTARNIVLTVLTAGLVALAAVDSGAQPDVANVFTAALVFLGLQRMALAAADAGTTTAVRTAGGSQITQPPPAATIEAPQGPVSG